MERLGVRHATHRNFFTNMFSRRSLQILTASIGITVLPAASAEAPDAGQSPSLIVVQGAGGDEDYEEAFGEWVRDWQEAGAKGGARVTTIGQSGNREESLNALRAALRQESAESLEPLWIVLLGHGNYDGQAAKFNLTGEDLTADELAEWLAPMRRSVALVAAFSTSGAFLKPLAAQNRAIVTATKSGSESNYARFGRYLARRIADPAADLDHDGQTSLLEAWVMAAQQTAEFYAGEGRLATEHSLLDDNGDGRGTPADFFRGLRAVKKAGGGAATDGSKAHQLHLVRSAAERALTPATRAARDTVELEVARLRESKAELKEDDYYSQLEALMLRLARIYQTGNGKSAD